MGVSINEAEELKSAVNNAISQIKFENLNDYNLMEYFGELKNSIDSVFPKTVDELENQINEINSIIKKLNESINDLNGTTMSHGFKTGPAEKKTGWI